MEGIDELETYLTTARILERARFANHGAHPSDMLILEGGVGVLAKPADATPDAGDMVPREVAAWVVARALGWTDLMATTVLRQINGVDTSVAVLWPSSMPDTPADQFPDDDVWRAAVFDVLVTQSDRSGHNWLAVPAPGSGGQPRLRLVDHGYAFDFPGRPLASSFVELRRDHEIPDDIHEALDTLLGHSLSDVESLIGTAARDEVFERARQLAADNSRLTP
jgi:hypothetical protein